MRNWFKPVFFMLLVSLGVISCQDVDTNKVPLEYDYAYFPLDTTAVRDFKATVINIDAPSGVYDTTIFYIREQFTSTFTDAASDLTFRLERLKKDSLNHAWQPYQVWSATRYENMVTQTEENIKYVKLRFPTKLDLTWDGDAYNRLDTLNHHQYSILELDNPAQIGTFFFDSVLTVEQRNELSLVHKLYFSETYARNIGMVYRQQTDIQSQGDQLDPNLPIEERVTRGYFYTLELINYE